MKRNQKPTTPIPNLTMEELVYGHHQPVNDNSVAEMLEEFEGPEVLGDDSFELDEVLR